MVDFGIYVLFFPLKDVVVIRDFNLLSFDRMVFLSSRRVSRRAYVSLLC